MPPLESLLPVPGTPDARVALLAGTRIAFNLSEPLHESIRSGAPLSRDIGDDVATEIGRLRRMGFWNETPRPPRVSDRHFSLSLHLVHGCNLACGYCNVQQGTYGGPPALMDRETAFAGLRYLDRKRDGRTARVIFYGGEPLLNWEVLTAVTDRAERMFPNLEMEIVTNATLLDGARARFLADHRIFTIVSLDGPKAIHDRNRPTGTGGGSYDAAVGGLRHLQEAGAEYHIRATWVPGSCAYDEVFHHLADLTGDPRRVTVGLEFHGAGGEGVGQYCDALRVHYEKSRWGEAPQPPFAHPFIDQVLKGELAPVPECEAGRSGFSVTPDGTLYPCQVSASLKHARLGTVGEGIDGKGRENLASFLHRPSPACADCWARPFCAGPCAFSAPLVEPRPFCRVIRLQVREALAAVAGMPHEDLLAPYEARGLCKERHKVLARGAALRAILWRKNRHIRPLCLFPQWTREG